MNKDLVVQEGQLEQLDPEVSKEIMAYLGPLEPQVHRVFQVPLVQQDQVVPRVRKVVKGIKDHLEPEASQEPLGNKDHKETKESVVSMEQLVPLELRVQEVKRVSKGIVVQEVSMVLWVPQAQKENVVK